MGHFVANNCLVYRSNKGLKRAVFLAKVSDDAYVPVTHPPAREHKTLLVNSSNNFDLAPEKEKCCPAFNVCGLLGLQPWLTRLGKAYTALWCILSELLSNQIKTIK